MGGGGSTYDYGFRIYNPQIGKFLSVDPLSRNFPWNSPYSYAENDVIRCIDMDGLEKFIHTFYINGDHTVLELIRHTELAKSGPLGDGHLYVYHNTQTGTVTEFYYNEIYKGNVLNETYVGPDNPTNKDGDDYWQAPQDYVDYAGFQHDKAYDKKNARGENDADNNLDVLDADTRLVQMSRRGVQMYKNNEIDPITGTQASYGMYVTGKAVVEWFDDIVEGKQNAMTYIMEQLQSTDLSVKVILETYNKANKTKYTTTQTREDLLPKK